MTFKQMDEEITKIATDLALTNNSYYTEADMPHFRRKLTAAIGRGGWKEVKKVQLEIKYAGTDEKKAAFMAGRED